MPGRRREGHRAGGCRGSERVHDQPEVISIVERCEEKSRADEYEEPDEDGGHEADAERRRE